MAKRGTARPWWRTPGLLLSGATLALLLSLGTLHHPTQSPKQAVPKKSGTQRPTAAATPNPIASPDPHQNPNWFLPEVEPAQFTIPGKPALVVQVSPIKRCMSCHEFPDLPVKIAGRIRQKSRDVQNLVGPTNTHFGLQDTLVRFDTAMPDGIGNNFERARTDFFGIRFYLPAFADGSERRHTLSHELVHFHTAQPDHMTYEPWANIGALLLEGHRRLRDPELQPSNQYYLGALQRAVVLGKNPELPEKLESSRTPEKTYDSLRGVSGYARPHDISRLRELYLESMSAYQSDDVFWDAAAWKFQHPMLVLDAMMARKLVREKNGRVLLELKNEAALRENTRQMQAYGKRKTPKMDKDGIMAFNYARPDLRNVIHNGRKDATIEAVDAAYYAALYRHFFVRDKSGRIVLRPQAVGKADRLAVLRWKKSQLDEIVKPIDAILAGNKHLRIKGRVGQIFDYAKRRGAEHAQGLKALRQK
ncbi:MAG: hypothetical protein Q8P02_00340 [Candidatus Micrarchaeota archaeon]|nr:hypothetical protein [Candidatus Micrarchaeota archaeon]